MTTNPYASPQAFDDPETDAVLRIRSVIRVFRMLGCLALLVGIVAAFTFLHMLATWGEASDFFLEAAAKIGLYLIPAVFSVFYFRAASRMARGDLTAFRRAKWFSGLIIIGFPLFPVALSCFPVFAVIGGICLRNVKRHYAAHCDALQLSEG